jgi:hypothetical protein
MVYVDPGDLGWQPLFHTWLKSFTVSVVLNDSFNLNKNIQPSVDFVLSKANWKTTFEPVLISLIQWLVPAALSCIRKFGVELVAVEENSKIS